jgi:hypothetical protein
VHQRSAYIQLLVDVTHSPFTQMLQPEVFRTLDIIYNSLHWLDDLSNEDLFGVDSEESDELGALRGVLLDMKEMFGDWRHDFHEQSM